MRCVYECVKFRSVSACLKSDMFFCFSCNRDLSLGVCLDMCAHMCTCVFHLCMYNTSVCAFLHNLYLIPLANILIDSHYQNI